jgi:ABC-type Fe3+ transport system permease subunit
MKNFGQKRRGTLLPVGRENRAVRAGGGNPWVLARQWPWLSPLCFLTLTQCGLEKFYMEFYRFHAPYSLGKSLWSSVSLASAAAVTITILPIINIIMVKIDSF